MAVKKFDLACGKSLQERLVNVNSFIFGGIYFPVRSNRLKDVGRFLGATWTFPDGSGLHSIAWRGCWEEAKAEVFKDRLVTYNMEDCEALRLLVARLHDIGQAADSSADVDFADAPKQYTTPTGQQIHSSLAKMIRSAHASCAKNRIAGDQRKGREMTPQNRPGAPKEHQAFQRLPPGRPSQVVRVRRALTCPRHTGHSLDSAGTSTERKIIDLRFRKRGFAKTITNYVGSLSYCALCHRDILPPAIRLNALYRSRAPETSQPTG
jgi:hypothetical protein